MSRKKHVSSAGCGCRFFVSCTPGSLSDQQIVKISNSSLLPSGTLRIQWLLVVLFDSKFISISFFHSHTSWLSCQLIPGLRPWHPWSSTGLRYHSLIPATARARGDSAAGPGSFIRWKGSLRWSLCTTGSLGCTQGAFGLWFFYMGVSKMLLWSKFFLLNKEFTRFFFWPDGLQAYSLPADAC